jgi:hypothetical protein
MQNAERQMVLYQETVLIYFAIILLNIIRIYVSNQRRKQK